MDPKPEKEGKAVVIDTNVILASILKKASYTRQILVYIMDVIGIDAYTPEKTIEEVESHLEELARRKGVNAEELSLAVKILLLTVRIVRKTEYDEYLEQAQSYTVDPDDVAFVALALALTRRYNSVILLTWNKDDYKVNDLKGYNVFIATPSEVIQLLYKDPPKI